MEYLIKSKNFTNINQYSIDIILLSLIDRPSKIIKPLNKSFGETLLIWTNNLNVPHRNYNLPAKVKIHYSFLYACYWYNNGTGYNGTFNI